MPKRRFRAVRSIEEGDLMSQTGNSPALTSNAYEIMKV